MQVSDGDICQCWCDAKILTYRTCEDYIYENGEWQYYVKN